MKILNSTSEDIDSIFHLYELATKFQQEKKTVVVWPDFERSLVQNEIDEHRQWKLVKDNEIACIWATTFSDPEIWEDKNADPAIYIHRIATNPDFRGFNFVEQIVDWAKQHAQTHQKKFIRLDTCGENTSLINYYQKCGFDFLGIRKLKTYEGLPAHYTGADVCFFQIEL